MPARFHLVSPEMWGRPTRCLSKEALIVLCYVRTCPKRVTEGIFQLGPPHVSADTPLTVEEAEAALSELHKLGLILFDPEHEVIFDPRALRDHPLRYGRDKTTGEVDKTKPDKRLTSFLDRFDVLPNTPLKQVLVNVAWETSDALAEAFAARGLYQEEVPTEPLGSPSEGTFSSVPEKFRSEDVSSSDEKRSSDGLALPESTCQYDGCSRPGTWVSSAFQNICDAHRSSAEVRK